MHVSSFFPKAICVVGEELRQKEIDMLSAHVTCDLLRLSDGFVPNLL